MRLLLLTVIAASAFSFPVMAEEMHHHSEADVAAAAPATPTTASTREYQAAMQRMHRDMDVPYTGDADVDFAAGMIPHHQGAIDMAEIQLKYGKDPELKRLARSIIVSQKKEIRFMEKWHAEHSKGK